MPRLQNDEGTDGDAVAGQQYNTQRLFTYDERPAYPKYPGSPPVRRSYMPQ